MRPEIRKKGREPRFQKVREPASAVSKAADGFMILSAVAVFTSTRQDAEAVLSDLYGKQLNVFDTRHRLLLRATEVFRRTFLCFTLAGIRAYKYSSALQRGRERRC